MTQPAPKVIKFPSIGRPPVVFPHIENAAQYSGVKKGKPFYNKSLPLPKLTFKGTVKLDGANCADVNSRVNIKVSGVDYKYQHYYQSRQKVLALENDFNGYAAHMEDNQAIVSKLFQKIVDSLIVVKGMNQDEVDSLETVAIFGEWCGEKIQKHIALSQLPKMLVIFGVKLQYKKTSSRPKPEDQQEWVDMAHLTSLHYNDALVYNVSQFEAYEVTVDFNDEKSKEKGLKKMDDLTRGVQEQCPVGRQLGVMEKMLNGEGIVWKVVGVDAPSTLQKFIGPKFWVKTGAKAPRTTTKSSLEILTWVGRQILGGDDA